MKRPHLLVVSHVLPFPGLSGQQLRVYYTLKALRRFFHITFLTFVDIKGMEKVREQLSAHCDEVKLLVSRYSGSLVKRALYRFRGLLYTLGTGLKLSNYIIGQMEFSPERIKTLIEPADFDSVLFEYWHATDSIPLFQKKGIPCILDMHNILWQSLAKQLDDRSLFPGWWKHRAVACYRGHEEDAWKRFNGIITVNAEEYKYVRSKVPKDIRLFHTPMGTDLNLWPYSWRPSQPPRLAYYGGLASRHNQRDALRCYQRIMPQIWSKFPKAELWLVGSNPPRFLRTLTANDRVKVTGYVEDIQQLLATMSVVICPWSGTYGFRSRLVEAMALGVPVAASPDAVYGMGMDIEKGLFIEGTDQGLAEACLNLIQSPEFAKEQSRLARAQVEEKFGLEATYGKLAKELLEFALRGPLK